MSIGAKKLYSFSLYYIAKPYISIYDICKEVIFVNRIKQVRQIREMRQQDLAKEVGVTQSTLSHWENGIYEPDISAIRKMCAVLNVSAEYLLGLASVSEAPSESVTIPVLGSVPAGIPIEAIEDIIEWEEIPASMCAGDKEYFALEVKGDSMWPDYLPGDIVIVQRQPCCESGDVCVVYVNGYDATLKQVKVDEDGFVSLIPQNPEYPPRTYSPDEVQSLPVTICGVVVELRRKIQKRRGIR